MKFLLLFLAFATGVVPVESATRLLFVATPGIRNYLEYGGHGLLVYDIDQGHQFIKRIQTGGLDEHGKPRNVKGVCASAALQQVFISTPKTMMALDLLTEQVLWEKEYEGGCDRMSISPDGLTIYAPSFEADHWNVVDGKSGEVQAKIITKSGAHNTVYGSSGAAAYLAGLKSPFLFVADTSTHTSTRKVGPFSSAIRPFTVNAEETLCFVNVNGLLGFEIGEISSGRKLHRVEVAGFKGGPPKRHGCPSHGIGLTPDENEIWVTDAFNCRMHIFSNELPPRQIASVELRDQPGWITFSIDGDYAYPSTGEVIDPKTRKVVALLRDENGAAIQSEKMVEIHFSEGKAVRVGDQFGIGRKEPAS